jgi:LysM repeat protein
MITPVSSAAQNLERAKLIIVKPKVAGNNVIDFRFNPTEYQLQKSNNFSEIAIPGLESPPIQFVRGNSEKLTVELLADTSDTLKDVREEYVNRVRQLMKINTQSHAPPIVSFVWSTQEFKGVIDSLNVSYTLFSPEGIPLRAKLSLTLKEYRPIKDQLNDPPKASPDVEHTWVVRRGDKYSSLAAAVYRDPAQWRAIAEANQVKDPRVLRPGTVLTVPKIR